LSFIAFFQIATHQIGNALVIFQNRPHFSPLHLVVAPAIEVRFAEALFRCPASVEIMEEDFGTFAFDL
jgi:hypothetical protein